MEKEKEKGMEREVQIDKKQEELIKKRKLEEINRDLEAHRQREKRSHIEKKFQKEPSASSSSSGSKSTTADESFTAIKRSTAPKPSAPPEFDIVDYVESTKRQNQPLAISKYPSNPIIFKHFNPTSLTSPSSIINPINTPSPPPSSSSLPSSSNFQAFRSVPPPLVAESRKHIAPSAQTVPRPNQPSLRVLPPQPSTSNTTQPMQSTGFIPTHHGIRTIPTDRSDPRVRAREVQYPSTPVIPTSSRFHLPAHETSLPKDPRRKADNVNRIKLLNSTAFPTPFSLDLDLYNGPKLISNVVLAGNQTCFHEKQIKKLILLASNRTPGSKEEIRITYTVPLKALNQILLGRSISIMSIVPKDRYVEVSKLKSFYQVNEIAGVVHHPEMSQALVLFAEEDVKKLSNLPTDTGLSSNYTRLCAVFIDNLSPRPKVLSEPIVYDNDITDPFIPYQWHLVVDYLKFPNKLKQLRPKSKFMVYGNSDTYQILDEAVDQLKQSNNSVNYVMMFDRYNESYFSRNLTKHKKESATQIWEYGVPDYSYGEMLPASEIFPNHSGGFVTTDMENIMFNPNIISTIISEINKLNKLPTVYGEWKFILPHNWLQLLKNTIKDSVTGQRAKQVIVSIVLALSNESIHILKLWCGETEELSHVQYLDRVAHDKYKKYQYFVFVDDILSVPVNQHTHSIDFVLSNKIYLTFG